METPADLYELLGVEPGSEAAEIKQAYYDKMKVCHPDVAGADGEEMCMLLNDAYATLSDPGSREVYDSEVRAITKYDANAPVRYNPTDVSPTWKWQPKYGNRDDEPKWTGKPLSRSLYQKVKPEDRGQKWSEQLFVYVDEWTCIACRNCCDVAPRTFCIDMDAGRARAYAQWGDTEEDLDYAVSACPVDCIYWVSRRELEVLEYVTRKRLYDVGNTLPCPMAMRQGSGASGAVDPFGAANEWARRMEKQEERKRAKAKIGSARDTTSASRVQERIQAAFDKLTEALRQAGWGRP